MTLLTKCRCALALTLLLSGCMATVAEQQQPPPSLPAGDTFPADEAERVLTAGFGVVAERYIEKISLSEVAFDGMRGITSFDPAVTFSRNNGAIEIRANDVVLGTYAEPAKDDPLGWAKLTVRAAILGRGVSPALRSADVEALYESVFDSALSGLDMVSRYSSAAEARELRADRNGYGGIGIVQRLTGGQLEIVEVFPGMPADKAGLAVGDRITHVDGVLLRGLTAEEISLRLRGAIDSEVTLTLRRMVSRGPETVRLTRTLVVPKTVTAELVGNVVHIRVRTFNQRTASSVAEALDEAKIATKGGLKGVVLDLRGNRGGLLDQAVAVSDLFLPGGGIVTTQGRHPDSNQRYDAAGGEQGEHLPMVVLVDGQSASSSEIVAAALQDNGRAVLIGTTSFGKGTVQTVVRLPNDGELTLTWSRFHSPSGYALQGLGVMPSLCAGGIASDSKRILRDLKAGTIPTAANLTVWRSTPYEDQAKRQVLRKACKPERLFGEHGPEVTLADRLLSDTTLFARALSLTAPVSARHSSL